MENVRHNPAISSNTIDDEIQRLVSVHDTDDINNIHQIDEDHQSNNPSSLQTTFGAQE